MKQTINIKRIAIMAIAVMLLASSSVFAETSTYKNAFVDSNTWTKITSAKKGTKTTVATVRITAIYKGNGSASNYQKVKVLLGSGGSQSTSNTVTKGSSHDITLKSNARAAGTNLVMYSKGNNPELDCKITGHFNAY